MLSDTLALEAEPFLRFACFVIVLSGVSAMEIKRPRRELLFSKTHRWLTNLGFGATNVILINLSLPVLGIAASLTAEEFQWGIFNIVQPPMLLSILLYLLIFDLAIYFQHRLFHAYAPLWKFHQMHHSDGDYDSSTGLRFHPVSIFISSIIKLGLIFVIGPPAIAVLLSEVILNATSIFNHSNWRLNRRMDTVLRLFLVTPDVHRIHHSKNKDEQNCNFGFNFLWWDKIFGTYKEKPELGHQSMHIGIADFEGKKCINYLSLLSEPFKTKKKVNL